MAGSEIFIWICKAKEPKQILNINHHYGDFKTHSGTFKDNFRMWIHSKTIAVNDF